VAQSDDDEWSVEDDVWMQAAYAPKEYLTNKSLSLTDHATTSYVLIQMESKHALSAILKAIKVLK
jgi:hypothetical protein